MKIIRNKIAIVPQRECQNAVEELRRAGRSVGVLNVAREEDYWFWTQNTTAINVVEYAKVPLHNDHNHAVELMAAIHVLRGLCERHERVVVTCQVAVNRSPAVVAVWVAQQFKLSWQDAAGEVKEVRRHMNTHRGLLRTIAEVLDNGPSQQDIERATL